MSVLSRGQGSPASALHVVSLAAVVALTSVINCRAAEGVTYDGRSGPGHGKHIVLVSGDDEYHSEEALPALAKILALRHGFTSTVLFAINPADGTIDPHQTRNIPGLEALRSADLMILLLRFRDLPDEQMKLILDYTESGKPILALRTSTHAFDLKTSPTYAKWSWNSKVSGWEGGYGRKVLGETWVAHHGDHGKQSTRALFAPGASASPILRGIEDGEIWVPTDTYEVHLPMAPTVTPLLLGQVLTWMGHDAQAVAGKVNDPMMPVAWTNNYTGETGKTTRVFTTTMGAADDLETEGMRRLLVNAVYWALGMETKIPPKADVALVGPYNPHSFLQTVYSAGVKPSDLELKR
jgi:hypothetical protein